MAEEYDIGQYDTAPQDPLYQGAEMKRKKQGPSRWRQFAAGAVGGLAGYGGVKNTSGLTDAIRGTPRKKRSEYY